MASYIGGTYHGTHSLRRAYVPTLFIVGWFLLCLLGCDAVVVELDVSCCTWHSRRRLSAVGIVRKARERECAKSVKVGEVQVRKC